MALESWTRDVPRGLRSNDIDLTVAPELTEQGLEKLEPMEVSCFTSREKIVPVKGGPANTADQEDLGPDAARLSPATAW